MLELLAKVVAVIVLSIVALDKTRGADEVKVVMRASACNVRVWLDVLTCNGVVSLTPVLSVGMSKSETLQVGEAFERVERSVMAFQKMKPNVDVPSSKLSESIMRVLV